MRIFRSWAWQRRWRTGTRFRAAAAIAAVPGTAGDVELENENGNVVYGVEVTTANGTVDIKIDAGNAKVLQTEKEDGEGEGEKGGEHEQADEANGNEASNETSNG